MVELMVWLLSVRHCLSVTDVLWLNGVR